MSKKQKAKVASELNGKINQNSHVLTFDTTLSHPINNLDVVPHRIPTQSNSNQEFSQEKTNLTILDTSNTLNESIKQVQVFPTHELVDKPSLNINLNETKLNLNYQPGSSNCSNTISNSVQHVTYIMDYNNVPISSSISNHQDGYILKNPNSSYQGSSSLIFDSNQLNYIRSNSINEYSISNNPISSTASINDVGTGKDEIQIINEKDTSAGCFIKPLESSNISRYHLTIDKSATIARSIFDAHKQTILAHFDECLIRKETEKFRRLEPSTSCISSCSYRSECKENLNTSINEIDRIIEMVIKINNFAILIISINYNFQLQNFLSF
jgi:hypothetical protein